MQKRISQIPFHGTEEQKQKLFDMIDKRKNEKGAIMPILQDAQEIYGYLPMEVQTMIAERLDVPLEEIFGVSTFYSQFALTPKGKYDISVCLGTACYVRGAQEIVEKISEILNLQPEDCTPDGKFSLTECRCIGACGLAPVMTINEEVYGRLTADEIPAILAKYQD